MKPVVILVRPQLGENIGMSARAMFNCGVEELRLVQPRDGWPSEKAMATSAECLRLMPEVTVFDSLEEASTDINYLYAATARPRYLEIDSFTPADAGKIAQQKIVQGQKVGFVFGGESSGLENDDIARCNAVITAPLNPDFKSLNLSQAVLLICWEWWQNHNDTTLVPTIELDTPPATHQHVKHALDYMECELDKRGFFKSETSGPTVKRNLRTMFNRINMNVQEVQCLNGIIKCLTDFSVKK